MCNTQLKKEKGMPCKGHFEYIYFVCCIPRKRCEADEPTVLICTVKNVFSLQIDSKL